MKWERVRFTVRCLHGCEIKHGEWALMLRSGHGCCERCALVHYKLVPKTYERDSEAVPERRHLSEVNE